MKQLIALMCATVMTCSAAWADAFPSKPIRLIIPYQPGGTTDIMARSLQPDLQKSLGQPLIIENKPGAAGVLAAREVARSPHDGYTLLFINGGILSVTPLVVPNAGYDGGKDFAPVALVSKAPMFLVVNQSVPAKDLQGFVSYVREQKEPVSYASAGVGSFGHLSSELFAQQAGARMNHIPYKGQSGTTNAIVSGEVKMLLTTPSATMNEFISNGRLHLLGVGSRQASSLAPGIPPIGSVLPGYESEAWFAILASAGTPKSVVTRLNEAINKALEREEIKKQFSSQFGVIAATSTPEELGKLIAEDIARWGPVVRERGIAAQ